MTKHDAGRSADVLLDVVVGDVRREADGVVSLDLIQPHGEELPAWTPGAHIDVILPNGLVRQYSLCGDPVSSDRWTIAVGLDPSSRGGSRYIHHDIASGHALSVAGPRNNFSLREADSYLFIAGGIGITPIVPMIEDVARRGKPWELHYGGRRRDTMAFLSRIAGIRGGRACITPQDERGLLDLDAMLAVPEDGTLVYCCGPGPLIDRVETLCGNWPAGALQRERFAAREPAAGRLAGSFEVELARSGRRLVVAPDASLLATLEEAGYDITHSCRAGICGTCELRVLGGIPDHLDDVLTDEERASGETMLCCVSRAKSDRLILDL